MYVFLPHETPATHLERPNVTAITQLCIREELEAMAQSEGGGSMLSRNTLKVRVGLWEDLVRLYGFPSRFPRFMGSVYMSGHIIRGKVRV